MSDKTMGVLSALAGLALLGVSFQQFVDGNQGASGAIFILGGFGVIAGVALASDRSGGR